MALECRRPLGHQAPTWQPVTFEKTAFIRVGSYTKKLQDHPALQVRLWNKL